jgi:hypothetical protein
LKDNSEEGEPQRIEDRRSFEQEVKQLKSEIKNKKHIDDSEFLIDDIPRR